MKIAPKIYLGFSSASLIPILFLGFFSYGVTYRSLTEQAESNLLRTAEIQKEKINQVLERNRERLALVASRTQLRISLSQVGLPGEDQSLPIARMKKILKDARAAIPEFKRITVVNTDGTVVASTDTSIQSKNWSTSPLIQRALANEKTTRFSMEEEGLLIELCAPLRLNRAIIGAVKIEARALQIINAVDGMENISQGSRIFLAQRDLETDSFHWLTPAGDLVDDNENVPLVDLALSPPHDGDAAVFHPFARSTNGLHYLAVTQPIPAGNLGLIVAMERKTAMADANLVLHGTLWTALAAMIVVSLIAFLITRSINRPVKDLADTSFRVARGELDARVCSEAGGELGDLIENFNHMIDELQDSTENLQSIVDQRTHELNQSNRELQHFASMAAHDLSAPLRSIGNFTQLLARRLDDRLEDETRDWIQRILRGIESMRELIEGLLSYSRIDSTQHPHQPVDINQVLEETLSALDYSIGESEASIRREKNLPTLHGDRTQLQQLFQNLIGNAIKYQEPGSIPEISISARKLDDKDKWQFSITDNGIGISSRNQKKIFEIFQRLHGSSSYSGSGIGLAMCQKVVERHGGEIWVESEPGKGSTFHFTLAGSEESPRSSDP